MRDNMPLPQHLTDTQHRDAMQALEQLELQEEWNDTLFMWGVGVGSGALGCVVGFIIGWLGM